jgi:hypothetical protein
MKKKVNPKVMNMIDTCVVDLSLLFSRNPLTRTIDQRREARSEPEKDARDRAERQGKDRADDRGARPVQEGRLEDDMGEGERVSSRQQIAPRTHIKLIFVASDFGGIFAELLPGNFSKLQPPDNQDLMDGLEIKVQLGSVWKQSLTELSGGQRYVCPRPPMAPPLAYT